MVRLSSNIHGNEAVGREMSLAFARWKFLVFVFVSLHVFVFVSASVFAPVFVSVEWNETACCLIPFNRKLVGFGSDDHCLSCHQII